MKNLNMESKILCPRHLLGASASTFMIAVICHKFVIVYKPMRTETGLAKCLNLIFFLTFFFHVVFFSFGCYPETKKQFLRLVGFLMLSGSNLFTMKSLLDTWKARFLERCMIKINPGLSQILSKVFVSKNMRLELTKYCGPLS